MTITFIAYILLILLTIWGGKLKIKPRDFHEDSTGVEAMKSLRGFAALGVILHHISQDSVMQQIGGLALFVNMGAYFVATFLFCSGFGLAVSLANKPNYLDGFVKKRIFKEILLTFYINILLYGIVYLVDDIIAWSKAGGAFSTRFAPVQWVTNLVGLTMMNTYAWFPIVMALLYLMFYLIFKNIKSRPVGFALLFAFIIGMGLFFCWNGHFAWWYGEKNWWTKWGSPNTIWWREEKVLWFNGEWWVNSAPAFLVGVVFGTYKDSIIKWFKKLYFIKLIVLLVIGVVLYGISLYGQQKFGYWTEFSGNGPDIMLKVKTYFCQIPSVTIAPVLLFVIMLKYYAMNPVTKFFGKYSYDTYMMNLLALTYMQPLQMKRGMLPNGTLLCFGGVKVQAFINSIKMIPHMNALISRQALYRPLLYSVAVLVVTILLGMFEHWVVGKVKKVIK